MSLTFDIERLTELSPDFDALRAEAALEGFRFLDRLLTEWIVGANRFDRPGDALFGVRASVRLIAIGGLNRDPFTEEEGVGRLRHLYVRAEFRRLGVASALLQRLLEQAAGEFHTIRLKAETPGAVAFYEGHGFVTLDCE